MITTQTSDALLRVIDDAKVWLDQIDEQTAHHKPSPERWSISEVIGHLVDSACNNHQRFIRGQEPGELTFPKYDQNFWVQAGNYRQHNWAALVSLWYGYNRHLAVVMAHVAEDQLDTPCTITPYDTCSLEFLITDYVDHLNHHLVKIKERIGAVEVQE